ncbi:hypothetical protein GCM10009837_06670 [Streptomyces durmitorensis]|uniref:Transposase n=1 Tax=Streptomyces durmitorensis TaxID=319947 RepID=A0ABY4PKX8_9ACTN|nr:hypothetical protein [Streptomyces durmitorensis]UQT54437.1 hypothetical protein M4V62_04645 [Streptomyces durmitorensis]
MTPAEHMRLTTNAIAADATKTAGRTADSESDDDTYADDQPTPERRQS